MDKILANRRLRRVFLLWVLTTVVLASLARWILAAHTDGKGIYSVLARVAEGFISSAVISVLVGLIIFVGTSEVREAAAQIEVLASGDISDAFEEAQRAATLWYFKGGLGRYATAKTIPNCLDNGRTGYDFRIFIVNPFDMNLCKYVSDARANGEDAAATAREAFTTIVEFCRLVQSRRTDISSASCSLIDDFSAMRVDVNDQGVIVTHSDKKSGAVRYDKNSFVYRSYRKELTTGPNSYHTIDIAATAAALAVGPPAKGNVSDAYVSAVLEKVVAAIPAVAAAAAWLSHPDEISKVVEMANSRKNPY
jgi:hypothetical protein